MTSFNKEVCNCLHEMMVEFQRREWKGYYDKLLDAQSIVNVL